jgi:hypothetical protein
MCAQFIGFDETRIVLKQASEKRNYFALRILPAYVKIFNEAFIRTHG